MAEKNNIKWHCFKISLVVFLCSSIYLLLYIRVVVQTKSVQNLLVEFRNWNLNNQAVRSILLSLPSKEMDVNETERHTTNSTKIVSGDCNYNSESDTPILTLFSTWTTKAEKLMANRNTLTNWASLKNLSVEPILFTNDKTLGQEATQKGWHVLPIRSTARDIPVLKDMYLDAMGKVRSHFYAFANGDILFTDSLVNTLKAILKSSVSKCKPMLIIGQRTNVKDVSVTEASTWAKIAKVSKSRGRLFAQNAEDYFISMRNYPWEEIPNLVVGRRAYDNWLVSNARKRRFTVIDATKTLLAVHQTSKLGNYEHNKWKNNEYNHKLLVKVYKKVYYDAGFTNCGEIFTSVNSSGIPVLSHRKVKKHCL